MYIKTVRKKGGNNNKYYSYLHLVENIRTPSGPRQKLILNLGNLDIDSSQFKSLAKRIEDILTGQNSFFNINEKIDKYAKVACDKIFDKRSREIKNSKYAHQYQNIELDSLELQNARTIGPEHVCHSLWKELKLDTFMLTQGISKNILPVIEAVVVGRVIEPASELHTQGWVENTSSLYELTGAPLRHSLNSYYRANDRLFKIKNELEEHLFQRENDIFSLKEKYFFFDLTNTYFEGKYLGNTKAKYGHSKEKRRDCKIITLGLVIDECGFAKASNLFEGNINETQTLEAMIKSLEERTSSSSKNKTVVMDAGIASEENIKYLVKNTYHYIVVGRGTIPTSMELSPMEVIKEDEKTDTKIEVKRFTKDQELFLLCHSKQKQKKEESMRGRIEQLFIDRLNYLKAGLTKPQNTKLYKKVIEAIGRLKQKYPKIAKLYKIEVAPEKDKAIETKNLKATDIQWEKKEPSYQQEIKNEGKYLLRTDRMDLSNKEIWDTYNLLRQIEYSFLTMKSHLGLRPNFHSKESRVDTHMFISVIAYHFLHIIEHRLRERGDTRKWDTIRNILRTHQRVTITLKEKQKDGGLVNKKIRVNTKPEPEHEEIYKNLNLSNKPLPKKIAVYKCSDEKNL